MTCRKSATAVVLVASLGLSRTLCAQQAKTPSLHEILARLQANLNHYDASVPSLFCDEHIVSSQMAPGERDQNTVTDSVFRLKRTPKPDHTTTLVESREIRFVDGKPAKSQHIDGPTLLSGAFEGGLAVVSQDQSSCMSYKLQRVDRKHPAEPYVISFATVLTPQNSAGCLLQENSTGRVLIDPGTMQIKRLEIATSRHTIIPGNHYTPPVMGKREISVDYSPVQLGGETFWVPADITMRSISGAGTFHMIVWSFLATYRNYHELQVTWRMLPGSQPNAP